MKVRIIVISEGGKVYDWDRAPRGTFGIADNVPALNLDGDFKYVCLVILY